MLNPKMKRKECYLAGILAAAAAISLLSGCGGGTPSLEEALKKTASYEQTSIPSPASDSLGGEWTVIALARSGEEAEDGYYEKYRANLEKRVKEQEGVLSETAIPSMQGLSWLVRPSGSILPILAGMTLESLWKILRL